MDFTSLIMAALVFLILSAMLIGLYFTLRGGQKKRVHPKPAKGHEGLIVVARLVRDKITKMLMVVMDGDLYTRPSELTTAQRQRLVEAAADLQKWLGQPAAPSAPTAVPAAPATPPASAQSEWVVAMPDAAPPIKPVSTNPLDALRHSMEPSKPAPVFRSITAQINDILQAKLAGTPLEGQNISLTESPNVGVIVRIGPDQYPGIEEVPDEQVRKLIRSAVSDWEAQHR